MFNLFHLLLVVATQITRSWCLHDTTQTVQPQHQTKDATSCSLLCILARTYQRCEKHYQIL